MIARVAIAVALVSTAAHAEPHRVEAVMNPMGASLSQEPRVANFASPMVELRVSLHPGTSGNWLALDGGVALLVLPEHRLEPRLGARIYPWRLRDSPGRFSGALYVRPGVHSLLSRQGGDVGPDIEFGIAPSVRGVALVAGVSLSANLVRPRVIGELRFGVGFEL